eukprot:CAMPEP_0201511326 /NCGR_PEP_ID=MMETSP0161_2-20130828/3807_1 /ASSEMBLY_ACC=CAM_ASM_000251 /TAXON_ID=180227 /ORGANISM="Neoparamoeba aestuarina, Strain SoJaBio B1-5/56/2" /LENGTH=390 /DNA_ID=CAMNT_0047906777 /DNA_START=133 /DNA_END=1302 /DNA_ORIENTATION=+
MTALTVLDVSCNLLSNTDSLEEAFGGLTNLVCLNCGSNNLKAIPRAVKGMTSMRWLNLFGNQIEEVDEDTFVDMKSYFISSPKARSIRLSYNRIKTFPKIFTQMLCLQELHMAGNDIDEIPEEIGNMRDLLVLSFANNGRALQLPDSISKLKKLRKMYLRGSQFQIPESLVDVNSLVEVDLSPGLKKELNPMFRLGIPLQISLENDSQSFHRYRHGVAKMSSKKNEDRFAIRTTLGSEECLDYYAVFDGHAGSDVSDYCSFHFHEILAKLLERNPVGDRVEELLDAEERWREGEKRRKVTGEKRLFTKNMSINLSADVVSLKQKANKERKNSGVGVELKSKKKEKKKKKKKGEREGDEKEEDEEKEAKEERREKERKEKERKEKEKEKEK